MFANLKEKLNERLKTFTVPSDPVERRLYELVDRATSDVLISPDWGVNMELVDVINSNPSATLEKATRVLTRPLQSNNTKVQLLALTVLETCIKNCTRQFHRHLPNSELFNELLRIADPPTQAQQASSEVKDRVLCLLEDLAKALDGAYRRAYESLLDNGVDFPVRAPEDAVPLEIPPEEGAPSADISEEDRAAIAAAMAELDAQAQAQQQQQQQQQHAPAQGAPVQGVPVAGFPRLISPRLVGRAPPPQPQQQQQQQQAAQLPPGVEVPALPPQSPAEVVKTAKAAGELLGEILQSVKAEGQASSVREAYISEMADQCKAQRSQLQELLGSGTDMEAVFDDALAAHESLQKALDQYNELLALAPPAPADPIRTAAAATALAAHGIPQHLPDYQAPTYVPPTITPPAAAAAAAPPTTQPAAFAGPQFTLDDDDDDDSSLVTKRQAAPLSTPPVLPPPPSAAHPATGDLIDLGSESGSPSKQAAPVTPPQGGASGDALLDEMDRLMRDSSLHPHDAPAKSS